MQQLIEESKVLFLEYSTLYSLDICTLCCVDKTHENLLRKSDRYNIPLEAIYEYNSSAKSGYTLETADELKYFAPRILELLVQGAEIHHSIELYLCRFKLVPHEAWSTKEIDFFNRYAIAYIDQVFHKNSLFQREAITDYLIMLNHLPIANKTLLSFLLEKKETSTLFAFASLYLYEVNWNKLKMANAFAEPKFEKLIIDFLRLKTTKEKLVQKIENLFWVEETILTSEEDLQLNSLYTILKNLD